MKKILLEYALMIGYTVTGLVFGVAFFLLFINFYHSQELAYVADVKSINATALEVSKNKIETIRNNLSVYNQNTYSGPYDIYALNTVQLKLQACLDDLESDKVSKYLAMDSIGIQDTYDFIIAIKDTALNDCLVMKVKSLFNNDIIAGLPNYYVIKPYVELDSNSLTGSLDYVQNLLEDTDHYHFSTDTNKKNFFSTVENSYTTGIGKYQLTLDLLVQISEWYKTVVVGG